MNLKNIAIIAHVDHGKTTLVDQLLKQSGTFRANQTGQGSMDSNDLEKERGITILAKATSILWKDTRINIVDTPGHADFGGEVERILSMVDSAILLVDAAEGPMPQTKFVLSKALKRGLKPIVVINKVDKPDARLNEVLDEIFDLFVSLDATNEQLDFKVLYASGKNGWANYEPVACPNMEPLLNTVVELVPSPDVDKDAPFKMLVTLIESDNFLGRILTGRIQSGSVTPNMQVKGLSLDGSVIETGRISKILAFRGLERTPVEKGEAGDIVALAGLPTTTVADTICDPRVMEAIPAQPIDPPTLSMTFRINDGPLAGTEGDKVTSRLLRDRLFKEAEGNVALTVEESDNKDSFKVSGRGELQMAVLVETMRREGFELCLSRPQVLIKEENGQKFEPVEEVVVDVDEEYAGTVVQKISTRKGDLISMTPSVGKQRLVFHVPTRGLIGYHGEFLTDTRGTGIMNRIFHDYVPYKGSVPGRRNGVLISMADGDAVAYALWNLEERGKMIINPGDKVYAGMIIGEHSRENDLEVNVQKGKKLTNMRASGKDEAVTLTPPIRMTLEKAISYINDDEIVEVTPESIRLRKRYLDPNERKRFERQQEAS